MKKKELKNLAQKIAKLEQIAENANSKEKYEIEQQIMYQCSKVSSLEEMMLLDEFIQEILQKS